MAEDRELEGNRDVVPQLGVDPVAKLVSDEQEDDHRGEHDRGGDRERRVEDHTAPEAHRSRST